MFATRTVGKSTQAPLCSKFISNCVRYEGETCQLMCYVCYVHAQSVCLCLSCVLCNQSWAIAVILSFYVLIILFFGTSIK